MMNKKIYLVRLFQEFDCFTTTLFRGRRIERGKGSNSFQYRYVFAENKEDAENKYRLRYKTDYSSFKDDFYVGYSVDGIRVKTDNAVNTPIAELAPNYTFKDLKGKMHSDDLLDYCRQMLLPVKELLLD